MGGCGEDNTPGVYASVSKGVCWIDYAMTCQFGQQSGSYSSYWGYSAQQCQTWMNGELSRLNEEVAAMQNAGSLTGRKKAAALAKGIKAQETLNKYSQCNVLWQPGATDMSMGATSTFLVLSELDQVLLKHQTR